MTALHDAAVDAGTKVVELASRVRGERAVHAEGLLLEGRLQVTPQGAPTGAPLLDTAGDHPAFVRFSRGIGLPDRLPDVHGLAIRVGGQDLLLDTAVPRAWLRYLPALRRSPLGGAYSSLLPYETPDGHRYIVAAFPVGDPLRVPLADLASARPRFRLALARRNGPWRPVATLICGDVVHGRTGRRMRFTVANDDGGLRAAGPLQDLRRRSYPASHVGRDA